MYRWIHVHEHEDDALKTRREFPVILRRISQPVCVALFCSIAASGVAQIQKEDLLDTQPARSMNPCLQTNYK